jgi:hypothetical protein
MTGDENVLQLQTGGRGRVVKTVEGLPSNIGVDAAVVPLEAFESLHQIYGEELAKARMANALLHQQLLDAGIEPVEKSAEDLLELFEGSQRILHEASLFAKKIGTSWELLDESWPRRR